MCMVIGEVRVVGEVRTVGVERVAGDVRFCDWSFADFWFLVVVVLELRYPVS